VLDGLLEPGRAGRLQQLPEELVRGVFHFLDLGIEPQEAERHREDKESLF
jgi:hypothetical protein